jgi:hypothetical protein
MASTPLLGLSLPADGTTNWGTLVNTSITALLDSAVAGTTTLTTDADVILSATTEAANESRQAIILWKPLTGTVTRNITAPAQSKTYVVINATGGTQSIVFRGAGPTTGVTIPAGKAFMLAWNGSDFVTTGVTTVNLATDVTGILAGVNGGTGVNNTGKTITLGGNLTTSGAFDTTLTTSAATNITLPTTGTLATLAGNEVLTNKTLTSPTLTAPVLGTPASGNFGSGTFTWPTFNQNTSGTAAGLSATLAVASGGTGVTTSTGTGSVVLSNNPTFGTDIIVNGLTVGRGGAGSSTNVAVGRDSMLATGGNGSLNTSVGANTGKALTVGEENTYVGGSSGFSNIGGSQNTAVGAFALRNGTFGFNTAVGYYGLYGLTTGISNTAMGHQAGYTLSTGSNNILIGTNAAASANNGTYQIVIGEYSTGKGNSSGFINPSGGGVYQGNNSASWSTTSDQRLKKNITDIADVLIKLKMVRVRNFEYRTEGEITELPKENVIKKAGVQVGPIAQELQTVFPECVKEESTGVLSVDPSNINWYLLKAIQELSARIEALEAK